MHGGGGRARDPRASDHGRSRGGSGARLARPGDPPLSDAPKDPLAIGLGALACGVGLGGGTIVAALVVVQALMRRLDPASYRQAAADPLIIGLFAGVLVGAAFGWRRSHALDNLWQRGVIAALGSVGGLLLGFIAWPVHQLAGLWGLVVWGLASLGLGVAGGRRAIRGGGERRAESGEP